MPVALLSRRTPLFPLPERTKWAVLAVRKVLALFVGASHVAVAQCYPLYAVLLEKRLNLPLNLRVGGNVRGDPALDDRLGSLMQDHASSDLCRPFVVGAVQSNGANGKLWWFI